MSFPFKTIIFLSLILIIIVGGVLVQIKLSKISKRTGLILPVISLVIAILATLGYIAFFLTTVTEQVYNDGVITQVVESAVDVPVVIINALMIFVLYNIPTFILYTIHRTVWGKYQTKHAVENMKLHDM